MIGGAKKHFKTRQFGTIEHCVEKQRNGPISFRGTTDVHKMLGLGWMYKMGILFRLTLKLLGQETGRH